MCLARDDFKSLSGSFPTSFICTVLRDAQLHPSTGSHPAQGPKDTAYETAFVLQRGWEGIKNRKHALGTLVSFLPYFTVTAPDDGWSS